MIKLDEKTNKFLNSIDNLCLLGVGGSHAYGTNVENSDIDIRGVYLDPVSNILGINDDKEQIEDKQTDTVIYSMSKIINLLSSCNPNTIELLGLREQDYIIKDDIGQLLIDNRHIFLSKQAYSKFYGYAQGQLKRLENALVNRANNDNKPEESKEILKERINHKIIHFTQRVDGFKAEVIEKDDLIDIMYTFDKTSRRDINNIINELDSIKDSLNKVGGRAGRALRKGDMQIGKHAMHLVRLYYMCIDILDKREIITYREKEHDILMGIRNGDMQKPDGSFKDEFYNLVSNLENQMEESLIHSKLKYKPDLMAISKLKERITLMTLMKQGIKI